MSRCRQFTLSTAGVGAYVEACLNVAASLDMIDRNVGQEHYTRISQMKQAENDASRYGQLDYDGTH